jgi:hypothetical protein
MTIWRHLPCFCPTQVEAWGNGWETARAWPDAVRRGRCVGRLLVNAVVATPPMKSRAKNGGSRC